MDVRTAVFDALPRRDEAEGVEAPAPEPLEMLVCLVELEDPPSKAHLARLCALPESLLLPTGLTARCLG